MLTLAHFELARYASIFQHLSLQCTVHVHVIILFHQMFIADRIKQRKRRGKWQHHLSLERGKNLAYHQKT